MGDLLRPSNAYFSYGTRLRPIEVDSYVYNRVRHFLTRRHKVPTRGTIRFSVSVVFVELGVLRLSDLHRGALPSALK